MALVALLLFLGGCGVGYFLQWTSFTYGDQQTGELLKARGPWLLAGCLLVGVGWERCLRREFVAAWRLAGWPIPARWVAGMLGVLLSVPWIVSGFDVRSVEFVVCGLLGLVVLEWMGTTLAYRSGGIVWGGLIRGLVMFVWGYALADWYGVYFTAYSYVTTGLPDYWCIAGGYLVAGLLVEGGARWLSR